MSIHSSDPQPAEGAHESPRAYATAVRIWLGVVAVFIAAMVVVGGLTRLTDSGLSITEWQLISGALPPLSEGAWEQAFAKYREIPEYTIVNNGMSLGEFKAIYWWEWGHRFLGRFIGLVFFVPFVFFWMKKAFDRQLAQRLSVIFILGGLQGALGWYMVKSGLAERVDVSQYRLAAHLGLAVLLFGCVLWTCLRLGPHSTRRVDNNDQNSARVTMAAVIVVAVFAQVLLGALVAGLHAGHIYNTWPLMEGRWLPEGLLDKSPVLLNFFENMLTVQFDHRIGAYVVFLIVVFQAVQVLRTAAQKHITISILLLVVVMLLQVILGIGTLLAFVPLSLAVLHQLGALVLFAVAIYHLHTLKRPQNLSVA